MTHSVYGDTISTEVVYRVHLARTTFQLPWTTRCVVARDGVMYYNDGIYFVIMESRVEYDIPPGGREEKVCLGQEFSLFAPERADLVRTQSGGYKYWGSVALTDALNLPDVSLTITALPALWKKKRYVITPQHPQLGYQITDEDFDADARLAKIQRLTKELNRELPPNVAPLQLDITKIGFHHLHRELVEVSAPFRARFIPEVSSEFRRLRLQLSFPPTSIGGNEESSSVIRHPGIRLEARLDEKSLANCSLCFRRFYPVDTGPLAVKEGLAFEEQKTLGIYEGLEVQLSDDPDRISQIHGRFVLAPEQPADGSAC